MPTTQDLEAMRLTLWRLSAAARADLDALLAGVDLSAGPALRRELEPRWLDLIATYGEASAALGADLFESWADEYDTTASVKLVRPVDEARAAARLGWALTTDQVLGNLHVLTDELVKQPARSTIQSSAHQSGLGWARVPAGDTCAFCLMLASRGAVYKTRRTAGGDGRKFHGDCDCMPIAVRSERDYPRGYNPDALYQAYLDARAKAERETTSSILSELRSQQDTN